MNQVARTGRTRQILAFFIFWRYWPFCWFFLSIFGISEPVFSRQLIITTANLLYHFKRGQLYLQEKPNAALLALNDPYNYQARKGIDFPWDASLYDGRYYLYWGPLPALLLTVFDDKFISKIGDHHLTFVFTAGLFIYIFVFSLVVWRHHFPKSPTWMFLLPIITMGLALPFTWILSTPRIYEAEY